jgi:hypothetical protein
VLSIGVAVDAGGDHIVPGVKPMLAKTLGIGD